MDELTKYVFDNYLGLLTFEEKAAYKSVMAERKIEDAESPETKRILRRFWVSGGPRVVSLLAGGPEAFFREARDRVLREHPDEVFLNYCPRCGGLARTPRARQCRRCFLSWHAGASRKE